MIWQINRNKLFFTANRIDDRQWLLPDGFGGYSNFTLDEIPISRYNNLYIYAQTPPTKRLAVLHSIIIQPKERPVSVEVGPFIRYHYKSYEKTIALYQQSIIISIEAKKQMKNMKITPLFSLRNHNHLRTKAAVIDWEFHGSKIIDKNNGTIFSIHISRGKIIEATPRYVLQYIYSRERERGMDSMEDLLKFFYIDCTLEKGERIDIVISPDKRDIDIPELSWILAEKINTANEQLKRAQLFETVPVSVYPLILHSTDFIVKRKSNNSFTIIAGYPWFTDWGRDAMISFEGLFLLNGKFKEAGEFLASFTDYIDHGLIPNHFTDDRDEPIYNTIDASLWYFIANYKFFKYTKNIDFIKNMLPHLREIIKWHILGTKFNIKMDRTDGLLSGGEEKTQLTWMDAKVGDWVITPRQGKAIEINALWYNAIKIYNTFTSYSDDETSGIEKKIKSNLHKFYTADKIFDTLYNDAVRPNMLIPLILPFHSFPEKVEKRIVHIVEEHLLTPYGIRTLTPEHPDYKSGYSGSLILRDSAYHQGTAWPFLTGFFIEALLRLNKNDSSKQKAKKIVKPLLQHSINDGCIGTIAEIFDGSTPQNSHGCFAQAWSVATILKALSLIYKVGVSP